MRYLLISVVLLGCGGAVAPSEPSPVAGTYDRAFSGSFSGSAATQGARCDAGDEATGGECFADGATVSRSSASVDGAGWECGVTLTPKGATVIAVVHCSVR